MLADILGDEGPNKEAVSIEVIITLFLVLVDELAMAQPVIRLLVSRLSGGHRSLPV